jgi:hypothetical protein
MVDTTETTLLSVRWRSRHHGLYTGILVTYVNPDLSRPSSQPGLALALESIRIKNRNSSWIVFFNVIWVENELNRIARNSIRIHSNEITKNSKKLFLEFGKKYYTKKSKILTVLIYCSIISLEPHLI